MPMTKEERRIRNSLALEIGDTTQVVERATQVPRGRKGRARIFGGGGIVSATGTGTGTVEHHSTTGLLDDDHTQYVHNTIARTVTANHTYSAGTINGGLTWSAAQDLNNQNLTNVDIDSGDIASGVVINKSPLVNFNTGDVTGSITLTNLATGTGSLTIGTDTVEGTMLNDNVADDSTIEISSNNLSVLKVPYTLTAGTGIATATFDGSANKTFSVTGVLEDINTIGAAALDGQFMVATGVGVFQYEKDDVARTSLALGTGNSPTFVALTLSQAIGSPPMVVTSTDEVANLNAAALSGADWDAPLAIGSTTPSTGAFTAIDLNGSMTITGNITGDSGSLTVSSSTGSTLVEGSTFTGNDVVIPGNLTVTGATVTSLGTTVQIEDKNMELAYNNTSGNDAAKNLAANAGGISLKAAASKLFVWYSATDRWTSSVGLESTNLYLKASTETKITFEDTAHALAISTIGTSNLGDIILTARYGCIDEVGGHTTQSLCEAAHDNKWYTQGITINNENHLGGTSFFSGFAGSGWRITKDAYNEYSAEFDNLTVRGTMSVYELLIQQIRATNGSLIVASADKVTEAEVLSGGSNGIYKLTVEADDSDDFIHFKDGDLILAQKWTGGSGSDDGLVTYIKRVRATVTETSNSSGSTLEANEFKADMEANDSISASDLPLDFVRIGSTSDTDRQGGIYITAEDSGAPFIDIFNDVDSWADWRLPAKTKARLGRLDGITHNGTNLSSYGLFSDRVYLTGNITATSGYIGSTDEGWTIDSDQIYNGNLKLNANDETIQLGTVTDFTNDDSDNSGIFMGKESTDNYDFFVGKENTQFLHYDDSAGTIKIRGTIQLADGTDVAQGIDGDIYATTSTSSLNVPTSHPTTVTLTVDTGLAYTTGQSVLVAYAADRKFTGTVTTYTTGTGVMVLASTDNTGTGSAFYPWDVNLEGAPGPQGEAGTPATTYYTWVKYGTSAAGAGLTDDYTAGTTLYIGMAFQQTVQSESTDPDDYEWSLIEGTDGDPGTDGDVFKQFFVYQNASSSPATASGGSVNSSGVLSPPSSWTLTSSSPAANNYTWISSSIWKQTAGSGTFALDTAWSSSSQLSGATGATPSDGLDARAIILTPSQHTINYTTAGDESTSVTFATTTYNTTGTLTYLFEVDGATKQAYSGTTTFPLADGDEPAIGNEVLVKVTLKEDGTAVASDTVTIYAIQDGADATTIMLSNEAHTLPVTAVPVVDYDGSGTDIKVWSGSTALAYGTGNSQFTVVTSPSNITVDDNPSTVSTYTRRYGDHIDMTQDIASITYTISVKDSAGSATAFIKTQSFSKSHEGTKGETGDDNQDFTFLDGNTSDLVGDDVDAGLHMTANYLGYHAAITSGMNQAAVNATFTTYMDSGGNFLLTGGSGTGSLSWTQSSSVLAIQGSITATTGYIGTAALGWDINSGHMVNGKVKLDAENEQIKLGDITDFDPSSGSNKGVFMGADADTNVYEFIAGEEGGDYIHWDGTSLTVKGDIFIENSISAADISDVGANAEANSATQNNPTAYQFGPDATLDFSSLTTPSTSGLYLGSNYMGFYDSAWKTYMDSSGNFYLGGTSGALTWASGTLSITGDITVTNFDDFADPGLVSLALVLNKSVTGADNDGEAAVVGLNMDGTPNYSTSGYVIWNGATVVIPHEGGGGSSGYSITTGVANTRGFICYDLTGSGGATFASNAYNPRLAFVWKEGDQWRYDGNTDEYNFTAVAGRHIIIGWLETGDEPGDLLIGGGLMNPVDISMAPESVEAGLSTGTQISSGGIELATGGSIRTTGIDYGDDGIFFGYDTDGYKLSCVNSSTAYMKWNGTTLDIKGIVNATSGFIGGCTIAGSSVNATQWSLNSNGSASFANGNITFASNGDITSNEYLIERSRLFGAGTDGDITIHKSGYTADYGIPSSHVHMAPETVAEIAAGVGQRLMTRGYAGGASNVWTLLSDLYADDFELQVKVGTAVHLETNGYRIFVKGTLTIGVDCTITNNGSNGSGVNGGDGAPGATLSAGTDGYNGGSGGAGDDNCEDGGLGGGGGGGGGIVFISARYVSNSGTIQASGGDGAQGSNPTT